VRIAGRWISVHILSRLTARSRSPNPPTRQKIVQDFCQAAHWRDRKGRLCVASANIALKRLAARGLVQLPPPAPRQARRQARQLLDDGQALPPPPASVRQLTVQLIQDQHDPDHLLWNRLIIREHPLKAAPLVGAQLRYLIRSPEGIVGAFGVGPPAYYLGCRDGWIGWDAATRQANLARVIGLSRFLLRPGVRCPNLASRCYGLLLGRVAADWQQRYGLQPLLIETFVDRSTHAGVSLSAANWRRLGQSGGRGRSSVSARVRPKTIKDVWVYELSPKARHHLLERPVELVSPRSVFHGLRADTWVAEELDGLDLGHGDRERRFGLMLQGRWKAPERSFYRSFESAAAAKAAYRFIESPHAEVGFEGLLAPHARMTQRRMAAESAVVLAQDTTALSYNGLHHTRGLGQVGDDRNPGRGLWLHSMHAFRLDGMPLGCAWAKLWARDEPSDTARRNEQSVAEKESGRWIEAYQAASRLARAMPQTHLIVTGDRESDIFELFDQTEHRPANLHLLVRAQHDRMLTEGHKLWQKLSQAPAQGTMRVRVPRRRDRPGRWAILELRWAAIELAPPAVALKKSWRPLGLYAVIARELNPPPGQDAIEWVLLTDWKVDCLKMAVRLVKWYGLRWGIECWHQVLKDVCKVETRQMESAAALERALVLDMIVAWRALLLCRLGKEHPALPANLYYSAEELAVLADYKKKLPRHAQTEPSSLPAQKPESKAQPSASAPTAEPQPQPCVTSQAPQAPEPPRPTSANGWSPTLFQANLLVAMLAGFWARKGDGHPGPKVLAEGLLILGALVADRRLFRPAPEQKPVPQSKRPRKPG
jgi:hypothetical protein